MSYPASLPLVRETGGRTQQIAEKYDIQNIIDLHVNKNANNTVCLCPSPKAKLKYPNGVDIIDFIHSLVIPFFYGLSYYEKKGKWPWGTYSHGDLGIFEFYAENRKPNSMDGDLIVNCKKDLKEIHRILFEQNHIVLEDLDCPCGSLRKFKNCHERAFEGAKLLKEDIKLLPIR
ncbi:MAG: SEC-C metal-binding domain-containing protein [bacterium]|nr:SEC-C metal-binding domain-containing protein [bacterium]